jgi:hypothetical protein
MSIASEISRLQQAKSDLATSIANKGVTVPAATTLDGYAALVDQIQQGGGGLPYDAEIEYLQSDGTAYINTGITPTLSHRFRAKFMLSKDDANRAANGALFGCFSAWATKSFALIYNTYTDVGYNSWGNKTTSLTTITLNSWLIYTFEFYKTYIDGWTSSAVSSPSGQPERPMYLFCVNNNNNIYGWGAVKKLAWARLYNGNNETVLDMIPVRVGQVGYMYDRVSGQLFGNAGTGNFILGADIT